MKLMNCPKCSEQVSNMSGSCPECGAKLVDENYEKFNIFKSFKNKKILIPAFAVVFFCLFGVCFYTVTNKIEKNNTETTQVITNKYYTGSINDVDSKHYLCTTTIKFSSNGVVQWVDDNVIDSNNEKTAIKFYGVYEIDGSKLTLTLSGEDPIICVIHDNNTSITIDGEKFSRIEPVDIYNRVLNMFDK